MFVYIEFKLVKKNYSTKYYYTSSVKEKNKRCIVDYLISEVSTRQNETKI